MLNPAAVKSSEFSRRYPSGLNTVASLGPGNLKSVPTEHEGIIAKDQKKVYY
jgi:hypothetical protein